MKSAELALDLLYPNRPARISSYKKGLLEYSNSTKDIIEIIDSIKSDVIIPSDKSLDTDPESFLSYADYATLTIYRLEDLVDLAMLSMSGISVKISIADFILVYNPCDVSLNPHVIDGSKEGICSAIRALLLSLSSKGKEEPYFIYKRVEFYSDRIKDLFSRLMNIARYTKNDRGILERMEIYDMVCAIIKFGNHYSNKHIRHNIILKNETDDLLDIHRAIPCKISAKNPGSENEYNLDLGLLGKHKINDNLYTGSNLCSVSVDEKQYNEIKNTKMVSPTLTHPDRFDNCKFSIIGDDLDAHTIRELICLPNVSVVKYDGLYAFDTTSGCFNHDKCITAVVTINVDRISSQFELDRAVKLANSLCDVYKSKGCHYLSDNWCVRAAINLSHLYNQRFSHLNLRQAMDWVSGNIMTVCNDPNLFKPRSMHVGTIPQPFHKSVMWVETPDSTKLVRKIEDVNRSMIRRDKFSTSIAIPFRSQFAAESLNRTDYVKMSDIYGKWRGYNAITISDLDSKIVEDFTRSNNVSAITLNKDSDTPQFDKQEFELLENTIKTIS